MSPPEPTAQSNDRPGDSVEAKGTTIFRELVGEKADQLCSGLCDSRFKQIAVSALMGENELEKERAEEIGFHISDWHAEAAFLVAAHLFPERFTPAEISRGILGFLIHAPNHVAAAAALRGFPVQDIFEVGALDGPSEDDDDGIESH
jgi:hypothetical protein